MENGKSNLLRQLMLVFAISMSCLGLRAQLSESIFGIQASARYGFLFPHRSTMGHLVQGHTHSFELGATFQMDGSSQWHHDNNLPSVSFVLSYLDFGNKEVLGTCYGARVVSYLPYFRKNGWSLGSSFGAGIGYATKKFDQQTNPKNNAIGSHLNALVNFGLKVEKHFRKSSLALELNMTHLSNGAYKLPNLGTNLPLVGIQMTHYLDRFNFNELELKTPNESELSTTMKRWSWYIQLILSTKQIYPTNGNNYGVISLTNFAQYEFSSKYKMEVGLDFIYNQSLIRDQPGDYGAEKNVQSGLYLAYIRTLNNVDFLLAMGRYVYNPLNPSGQWYHKLGARVRLTPRLKANIVIKAHWARADYFEYGLTYRW
jgi:hypothetical protein